MILANNGHLESFGFAANRLMHVFPVRLDDASDLDADALRRLGGRSRWGITPSDPMGTTMRRIDTGQGGNRIITRTCASFRPGMETSAAALRRATRIHHRKFAARFPALAGTQMEYSWAGHLCLSRPGSRARPDRPGAAAPAMQTITRLSGRRSAARSAATPADLDHRCQCGFALEGVPRRQRIIRAQMSLQIRKASSIAAWILRPATASPMRAST